MAENLKYNLRDELEEADRVLMGSNSLIGMTVLSNSQYNNSARAVMNTSHLKQFTNLKKPDIPLLFTGGENLVGANSTGYRKIKHDSKVVAKVVKYDDILEEPNKYYLFIYDKKIRRYDVIERTDFNNLTEVYGYEYNNEGIDSLEVGDDIPAGEVLLKSTSYDEDMNYGYGKNVLIQYCLDPLTIEDACVPQCTMAKSMISPEITTYEIGVNDNDFLLNLYGNNKHYQPFPEIGEETKGLVAAKRTLFNNQLLTDFKDSELSKVHDSDMQLYIDGVGTVTDITIFCNNPDIEETPFNAQIMKYYRSQTKFYRRIVKICEKIMDKCVGIKRTKKTDRIFSHELDYLYKRAKEFLDTETRWRDNDSAFGHLKIFIDVVKPCGLAKGQKIVARSGNKSVVSEIRPDNEMPYIKVIERQEQEDGTYKLVEVKKYVQLKYNALSITNRTTGFPLIEMSITFLTDTLLRHLWTMNSTEERANLFWDILIRLSPRYANQLKVHYDALDDKGKDEYMEEIMNGEIYICQPPMWEDGEKIFYKINQIYKDYPDIFKAHKVYINKWGREIETLNPCYMGYMYFMKLKQTPRKGYSARGSGAINNKGLPDRSYGNKSHIEKTSSTAIRFGEFETLNFVIGAEPEDLLMVELTMRTSVKGRHELAKHLLSGEEGTFKISKTYTSRTAEILAVLMKYLGLEIDFVNPDSYLTEYDDSTIRLHEYEGKDYLCTNFQFMLVKRRKEIEKEILHEHGIIDGDEFEKLVMERLKSRHYINGPDKSEYDTIPGLRPDTVE